MVRYYQDALGELPYDPWTAHAIPLSDLLACADAEGVEFREADILLVRAGFTERYNAATDEEREKAFKAAWEAMLVDGMNGTINPEDFLGAPGAAGAGAGKAKATAT